VQVQDPGELGQQLLDVLAAARRRTLLRTGKMPRNAAGQKRFQVGKPPFCTAVLSGTIEMCRIRIVKERELFRLVGSGSVKNHFSDLDPDTTFFLQKVCIYRVFESGLSRF
jgi:hypothetical protein